MKPNNIFSLRLPLLICVVALLAAGCKKASLIERTTEDVNIKGYLEKYPDKFSEFSKIVQRSGSDGFLQAYGSYTLFLPTNDAIKTYLQKIGKSAVEDVSPAELKDLVRFHLLEDTIRTTQFTDGKLPEVTMLGQYLITGQDPINPTARIIINRQANLEQGNIKVGNGIIHIIDQVLIPAKLTVAKIIEANPDFSIFTEALRATGLYDRLNVLPANNTVEAEKYLTVLAETNKALADAKIFSFADLKNKYSKTADPKNNINDSLYLYVAYHVMPEARYFADLVAPISVASIVAKQNLSTSTTGDTIKINEVEFDGKLEKGAPLDRLKSDVTATNGVVHTATKHFTIVKRYPTAVYYQVDDQPEFRKQTAFWRKGAFVHSSTDPPLSRIKHEKFNITYEGKYTAQPCYFSDCLRIPMGGTARSLWTEYITPLIVEGVYKFWICYPVFQGTDFRVYFDGVQLSRNLNTGVNGSTTGMTEEQREVIGWKRYMGPSTIDVTKSIARLMGTVEVKQTGTHTVRFEWVNGGANGNNYLIDMFHFIPVTQNQLWPKFYADGSIQKLGEPDR